MTIKFGNKWVRPDCEIQIDIFNVNDLFFSMFSQILIMKTAATSSLPSVRLSITK